MVEKKNTEGDIGGWLGIGGSINPPGSNLQTRQAACQVVVYINFITDFRICATRPDFKDVYITILVFSYGVLSFSILSFYYVANVPPRAPL